MEDSRPRRVVVIVYDGVVLVDLVALDVFTGAQMLAAAAGIIGYKISVVAANGGVVSTGSNAALLAEPLARLDGSEIDTILVPGSLDFHAPHPPDLIAWLGQHAPKVRRVVSICVGAFVLAKAGLLSGRRVTTHWAAADALRAGYPDIRVEHRAADWLWR